MFSNNMKTYSRYRLENLQKEVINLNELCRLCMTQEDELVPIFDNEEPIPLTLKIMACVALEVFEGDGLPDKICYSCQNQLEQSYSFRKKCEVSDLNLRNHVKGIRIKSDDSIETQPKENFINITNAGLIQDDIGNITLSIEECEFDKDTHMQDNIEPKTEIVEVEKNERDNAFILDESSDEIENQTIAEAVKNTLASHPNLNLSGNLQIKVDQQPGKLTQVEITTENGSVMIMELTTDDVQLINEEIPNSNEDGKSVALECSKCPKKFARETELRRHASVHTQQKRFSCNICQKWFSSPSALINHGRIHTGTKLYQCDVCQKYFARKTTALRHCLAYKISIRTQTACKTSDIKVFKCSLCPKVFCRASGLSKHSMIHIGKSFKCRGCDKSFADKNSLRKHHRQTMHQA